LSNGRTSRPKSIFAGACAKAWAGVSCSPAMRRQDPRGEPLANEINHRLIASSPVDDRRTECRTTKREGSDRQSANRHAQSQRQATEREQEAEGGSTDGHKTTSDTSNRHTPDREVPNGDNTLGHSRTHRDRINTGADVNERPAAEAGTRPVLESKHRSLLDARAADKPRGVAADALAADSLLADGTQSDCG
jgi:hypothetical protein